jgi:hypothetical protein
MADLSLTKTSRRLKVNIGAVLCTRVNTGDYGFVKLPADAQEDAQEDTKSMLSEQGCGDGLRPMLDPLYQFSC